MTKLVRADCLSDAEGACIELETSEGPLEIRLTHEDGERLIAALQSVQAKLPKKQKTVASWGMAIDPVNQDAVLLARYSDETTQETRIPGPQVAAVARFLDQASQRFESGAEMRQ
jgi:hypothetical protein